MGTTQFSTCIFHRVTGTVPLPVPLPLDDVISTVVTLKLNENVSTGQGNSTPSGADITKGRQAEALTLERVWCWERLRNKAVGSPGHTQGQAAPLERRARPRELTKHQVWEIMDNSR